jgi:CHAD domain-containing protein
MPKPAENAILPRESPLAGVQRIANAAIDRAVLLVAAPSVDPDEDIHVIRSTTKQLRALLRLVRLLVPDEAFRRQNVQLRKAARMLAGFRDAGVALETLAKLAEDSDTKSSRMAFEEAAVVVRKAPWVHDHQVGVATVRRVGAALESARPRWHSKIPKATQWRDAVVGLEAVYRACRSRRKKVLRIGDEESFHRWRIRVKNLYFQVQFLCPIWPKRLGRMTRKLQKLQGLLGDLHDLTVLEQLLRKQPKASGAVTVVLESLDRRRQKLRKRACKLGNELFAQKPAKLAAPLRKRLCKWAGESIE